MKNWIFIAIAFVLVACGSEKEADPDTISSIVNHESTIVEYPLNETKLTAVEYSNQLSLIQKSVWDQIETLFTSDSAHADENYSTAVFEIETKLVDLRKMPVTEGGDDMKTALIDLCEFYQRELNTHFKPILPLLKKSLEELTRAEQKQMDAFDIEFALQEKDLLLLFMEKQDEFAVANNFQLQEI